MSRIIEPFKQFLDGNGDPLVDGWLRFLVSGTNNTDKATYADSGETIANTNPLQLDAEGRCPNVFGTGTYRVVSYTNDLVDDIPAEQIQSKDPVGGSLGTADFSDWEASNSYDEAFIVVYDGRFWQSLSFNNLGNPPDTSDEYWKQIDFISYWNATTSYSIGDNVRYLVDGFDYVSLVDTNLNNIPPSSTTDWESFAVAASVAGVQAEGVIQIALVEAEGDTQVARVEAEGDYQFGRLGLSPEYVETTSGTTVIAVNTYVAVDTSGGAFTLDLPTPVNDYDFVQFKDVGGSMSSETFTVGRNSMTIMGLAEDLEVETDNVTFRLTYFESTSDWRL